MGLIGAQDLQMQLKKGVMSDGIPSPEKILIMTDSQHPPPALTLTFQNDSVCRELHIPGAVWKTGWWLQSKTLVKTKLQSKSLKQKSYQRGPCFTALLIISHLWYVTTCRRSSPAQTQQAEHDWFLSLFHPVPSPEGVAAAATAACLSACRTGGVWVVVAWFRNITPPQSCRVGAGCLCSAPLCRIDEGRAFVFF